MYKIIPVINMILLCILAARYSKEHSFICLISCLLKLETKNTHEHSKKIYSYQKNNKVKRSKKACTTIQSGFKERGKIFGCLESL